jgi:hypothetical protein
VSLSLTGTRVRDAVGEKEAAGGVVVRVDDALVLGTAASVVGAAVVPAVVPAGAAVATSGGAVRVKLDR